MWVFLKINLNKFNVRLLKCSHLGFFGLGFISVFELVLSLDLVLNLFQGFLNKLYIFDIGPYSYTLIIILDLRMGLVV